MISPTKGISPQRALLTVAAQVAIVLEEPMTVSQTWARLREWRRSEGNHAVVSYAWFVLALDVLFSLGVVRLDGGLLSTAEKQPC